MRLIVIVSGDYGELGIAMSFVTGLKSTQCTMLLPASLAHTMARMTGVSVRSYASLVEVRAAIAELQPQAVMFASGYLLGVNSGLSTLDSVRLVRAVRKMRIAIVTSDPFLGLLRSPTVLDFRDLSHPARDLRHALVELFGWRQRLRLFLVAYQLRREWHLYPGPIERLPPQLLSRRLCSFNAAVQVAEPQPAAAAGPPLWLFILSKTDYEMHLLAQGEAFVAQVIKRLEDGIALGRRVLLIGPDELVEAVRGRIAGPFEATSHGSTNFAGYVRHLASAEYAFFWNYYSFSIMQRVLTRRPVFFFDEGHMVRIMPALHEAGIRMFYDGWRPPLLLPDATLREDLLASRAAEVERQFVRIAEGLNACPSPDEVLRRVTAVPRSGSSG